MGTACNYYVGVAIADKFICFADGLGTGCASCQAAHTWPAKFEQPGQISTRHIWFLFEFADSVHTFEGGLCPLVPVHFATVVLPAVDSRRGEIIKIERPLTGA